jgi:hypothetical protein
MILHFQFEAMNYKLWEKEKLGIKFPNPPKEKGIKLPWGVKEYGNVATPLWAKCEDKIHTPKSGVLESFGTPATLEFDSRGQNTSP